MRCRFVKMEGAGNDYVYVDTVQQPFPLTRGAELARKWSDRHYGIGADGLILLVPSDQAAVGMRMWNADGSLGLMCGNGLRCVAQLAHRLGLVGEREFTVETGAGRRRVEVLVAPVDHVRVDLGEVTASASPENIAVAGRELACHVGSAGNPHAVVFLETDPEGFPVRELGAALQSHPRFPGGVNVGFVQVLADGSLRQRTYERGSGETLACGTGAAVAAMAALRSGRVHGTSVLVHLRGGDLRMAMHGTSLVMEGPVRTVFEGEIEVPEPD
jgi:diaminopimelate epimerase